MAETLPIEVQIEPVRGEDRASLLAALEEAASRDSTFAFLRIAKSQQFIVKGVSEVQLDEKLTALCQICPLDIGAPQVAYRETLRQAVEQDFAYKTLTGYRRQFAKVDMLFTPERGTCFESRIPEGGIPSAYIAGVEQGVMSFVSKGPLAGFPVVDVKAILVDGAYHDTDSSMETFEYAARGAFRLALQRHGQIIEPIMEVKIIVPDDDLAFVLDDLLTRRGQYLDSDKGEEILMITATVPLANTFGYINQLRSGTQGRASLSMRFSHYAPIPPPDDDDPFAPAAAKRA